MIDKFLPFTTFILLHYWTLVVVNCKKSSLIFFWKEKFPFLSDVRNFFRLVVAKDNFCSFIHTGIQICFSFVFLPSLFIEWINWINSLKKTVLIWPFQHFKTWAGSIQWAYLRRKCCTFFCNIFSADMLIVYYTCSGRILS